MVGPVTAKVYSNQKLSALNSLKLAAGGRPSTWSPPGRLVEHHGKQPTDDWPTTDQRSTDNWLTTNQQPTDDQTDDRPTIIRRPTNDRPTTARRPIAGQNYFKTMPNHPRNILTSFTFAFNSFIKLSNFLHFLTSRTSNFARVEPYLKVYREANSLACALALMWLRHRNLQPAVERQPDHRTLIMVRRVQENLLLYRLLGRRKDANR